jgi:hypothetical protein
MSDYIAVVDNNNYPLLILINFIFQISIKVSMLKFRQQIKKKEV